MKLKGKGCKKRKRRGVSEEGNEEMEISHILHVDIDKYDIYIRKTLLTQVAMRFKGRVVLGCVNGVRCAVCGVRLLVLRLGS